MRIQAFARLTGLSTKTIRFYESKTWYARGLWPEYALLICLWKKSERFWRCRIGGKRHAGHC